jgi:hypothetical protein
MIYYLVSHSALVTVGREKQYSSKRNTTLGSSYSTPQFVS